MALAPTPAMNLRARLPRMDVASPPVTRTLHVRVVVVAPLFFSVLRLSAPADLTLL